MADSERDTHQRRAIRKAFEEDDRPLSPQEVLEIARGHWPGLGIATVYRTLRSLLDSGALIQIPLPGEPARYERAGKKHHHHFHCTSCGKVFEIHACPGNINALTPEGFLVEGHEITLTGICVSCA